MNRETAFWIKLREKFYKHGILTKRVTEKTTGGYPDIVWLDSTSGKVGWLELKSAVVKTPRSRPLIEVRKDQALFLREWKMHNGLGGILVEVNFEFSKDISYLYFEAIDAMEWVKIWPNPSTQQIAENVTKEWVKELPMKELILAMTTK